MPSDTFQKKTSDIEKKKKIGSYFIKAEETVTAQQ